LKKNRFYQKLKKTAHRGLVWLILLAGFWSCVPTRNLKKNEYLLFNQKIEGNDKIDILELEVFYRQKPNRKILLLPFTPYLSLYYIGKRKYDKNIERDSARISNKIHEHKHEIKSVKVEIDSIQQKKITEENRLEIRRDTLKLRSKIGKTLIKVDKKEQQLKKKLEEGNWLMTSVGEPPSIYDSTNINVTLEQMQKYLKHEGYFSGEVSYKTDTSKKKIDIVYSVSEGEPHIIDSLLYQIPDSAVKELMKRSSAKSNLKAKKRYDESNLESERLRIYRLMKDHGYYNFVKSYILFEVDTTMGNRKAHINTIIRNPQDKLQHKLYRIDTVIIQTDVNTKVGRNSANTDTLLYNGITYIQEGTKYSKRVLDSKIFVRKDVLYSQTHTEETQRSLAGLNMFKFINIKYDTTGGEFKTYIFASPYPKYQLTAEGGLNVTQALPGPFVSGSYLNRNIFRGAEIFELRARFALEAQTGFTDPDNSYRSLEWGINGSFTFPRILFPIPSKWKKLVAYRLPQTTISAGYSSVERAEYARDNVQAVITYQWQNKSIAQFSISLLDLAVINTSRIDDEFLDLLRSLSSGGNSLVNSFDRSLVSSTIFTYTKASKNYGSFDRKSKYIRLFAESGGTYLNLVNKTLIENKEEIFGLRYYRFYKFAVDQRFSFPIAQHGLIATRLHAGVAQPYGKGTDVLPYEKFFFSGGSNSNRAWRARRVGPGSYTPDTNDDGTFDYSLEQPGEVILEGNIELRTNVFGFVDGALFVDATNVWTLSESIEQEGSKFEPKDFLSELAVGAGFGVRLDFSFLLIRFDVGVKIFDPARPTGQRYIGDNISLRKPLGEKGQSVFNIGIGYPF
jgi:outer membrane protein insertion porin family